MPDVGAQPDRGLAHLLGRNSGTGAVALRLLQSPGPRQPGANTAGKRICVAVAHVGHAVVEVVKVEHLIDQLRLRLDQPAIAEVERIAALDRGGQPPAVGLAFTQAAVARHGRVVPGRLQHAIEIPVVWTEMRPVAADAIGIELVLAAVEAAAEQIVLDVDLAMAEGGIEAGIVAAAVLGPLCGRGRGRDCTAPKS